MSIPELPLALLDWKGFCWVADPVSRTHTPYRHRPAGKSRLQRMEGIFPNSNTGGCRKETLDFKMLDQL